MAELIKIEEIMNDLQKKIIAMPTGKEWQYNRMLKDLGVEQVG